MWHEFNDCINLFEATYIHRWYWMRDDFGFEFAVNSKEILDILANKHFKNKQNEKVRNLYCDVCTNTRIIVMPDYNKHPNKKYWIGGLDLIRLAQKNLDKT